MRKVIMAVGATGGHFSPALNLASKLKKDYAFRVSFLGPIKKEFIPILQEEKIPHFNLKILSRRKGILNTLLFTISLIRAIFLSFCILFKERPHLTISTGSFGSVPGTVASYLWGVPVFIQEQNVIPGLANRILSKLAKKVFLGFPGDVFPLDKVEVTGNPVKEKEVSLDREGCYRRLDLDKNLNTLLIFGGSQGAEVINRKLGDFLEKVEDLSRWQILHISGGKNYIPEEKRWGDKVKTIPFLYPMEYAYRISQAAICRGGALSLSELSLWGIPAFIFPHQSAMGNHQLANALYFEKGGGAVVIRDLEDGRWIKEVEQILNQPARLKSMGENMKTLAFPDATEKICRGIKEYFNA